MENVTKQKVSTKITKNKQGKVKTSLASFKECQDLYFIRVLQFLRFLNVTAILRATDLACCQTEKVRTSRYCSTHYSQSGFQSGPETAPVAAVSAG